MSSRLTNETDACSPITNGTHLSIGGEAMGIFDHYQRRYEAAREEEYTLQEFLEFWEFLILIHSRWEWNYSLPAPLFFQWIGRKLGL